MRPRLQKDRARCATCEGATPAADREGDRLTGSRLIQQADKKQPSQSKRGCFSVRGPLQEQAFAECHLAALTSKEVASLSRALALCRWCHLTAIASKEDVYWLWPDRTVVFSGSE